MEYPFTKAEATGNDFIIIEAKDLPQDSDLSKLAIKLCKRKKSIGADGILIYDYSNLEICDFKLRIFNPDGKEVEMCGNGARCISLYAYKEKRVKDKMCIETRAGSIEVRINNGIPKLKLTDPKDTRLNFGLHLEKKNLTVNFVNTGVPHVVCFVEDLSNFDVYGIGRAIRYHKEFKPEGANADFVKILDSKNLKIRTYERGVEDETLACGTGAVASVITAIYRSSFTPQHSPINVHTRGGEILRVYFEYQNNKVTDVWLEGNAEIVYEGQVNLSLA